jgi:hypothetical protein
MFSNLFIFKIGKEEQKVIADEIININKKYIDDIFKMVFTEKYKFLFINVNEQRFFDGFDELLIEE